MCCSFSVVFFFFNDTATTEIYTLSLHDALPISHGNSASWTGDSTFDWAGGRTGGRADGRTGGKGQLITGRDYAAQANIIDRKSTRLNSSHLVISYAVFCLKKKKTRAHTGLPY